MNAAIVVSLALTFCHFARPDEAVLTFDQCLQSSSLIVDATIESFTEEGYANLKVHSVLKGGKSPTIVKWVHRCTVQSVRDFGKVGSRWIFCSSGDSSSVKGLFEVRTAKDGSQEYRTSQTESEWISLAALKERLAAAVKAK